MPSNYVFGRASVGGRRVIVSGDDFTVRGGSADATIPTKNILAEHFFARATAEAFLADAARSLIELAELKDGFFPYQGADIEI